GHDDYMVLAAGTDGRDGASDDAGAIVDGATCERARDGGFDPAAALAAADTGRLLESTGDLIYTGPTGTNVGDLVIALRLPPDAEVQGRMPG
ncbi:MAG TPA: MOFRL family protein, partial [Steroidobacteraceae bacterium]|nr:MOFRL family protein [Steroidobacteraceae bacterium]